MTVGPGNRYFVAMAPTVYENQYHFNARTGNKNIRYFLIVILITIIVQQSVYWSVSQHYTAVTKGPRPEHRDRDTGKTVNKRHFDKLNRQNASVTRYDFRAKMCSDKLKWTRSDILGEVTSDMEYWSFDRRRKCPEIDINDVRARQVRLKLSLKCDSPRISLTWTNDTSDVYSTVFGDECLDKYISSCCKGGHSIPNVVHYVWYSRGELSFVGFMSLVSVIRFVNPCLILFHGDSLPYGRYWNFILTISPNIIHVKRKRPRSVFGQRIYFDEHSGDIMRIEALLKYGGIYMDMDTIIVKPIDELRKYQCVMSTQYLKLGSAFILAEKNATFLKKWMDGYKTKYDRLDYTYNAMTYPQLLAFKHSDLIHVEVGTVSRPKDMIGLKLYSRRYETYNWSKIYGVHLFTRVYNGPLNETTIRNMHSACGSILRHVLFGNKELCKYK